MAASTARERRGFGRIQKLPSGNYRARYVGPDGRLHSSRPFSAKDYAASWLGDERKLIDAGSWVPPKLRGRIGADRTLADYAEDWLRARTKLKPRTQEHYRRLLDRQILPTLGDLPLKYLTPDVIDSWHAHLGGDTPTLRAHAYSLLRAILNQAVGRRVIESNPCQIRGAGNSKRVHRPEPLTVAQVGELVAAMPERYRVMTLLAAWCGLRFGELAALRRSDLDMTNGIIRIRRGIVRVAGKVIEGTPKSDAGIRDVVIPAALLPAVREHLSSFVNGRDGLLFPAADGVSYLQPSTLYGKNPASPGKNGRRAVGARYPNGTVFYGARAAIGRPDLRWHDLRHTGAVLAAATGATLADLMARLGHSTPGAALRYQHQAKDADRLIADRLSAMIEGTT